MLYKGTSAVMNFHPDDISPKETSLYVFFVVRLFHGVCFSKSYSSLLKFIFIERNCKILKRFNNYYFTLITESKVFIGF